MVRTIKISSTIRQRFLQIFASLGEHCTAHLPDVACESSTESRTHACFVDCEEVQFFLFFLDSFFKYTVYMRKKNSGAIFSRKR